MDLTCPDTSSGSACSAFLRSTCVAHLTRKPLPNTSISWFDIIETCQSLRDHPKAFHNPQLKDMFTVRKDLEYSLPVIDDVPLVPKFALTGWLLAFPLLLTKIAKLGFAPADRQQINEEVKN